LQLHPLYTLSSFVLVTIGQTTTAYELRSAIKPVVLGKRIELIRTDNPYADLKPGDMEHLWTYLNCLMKISLSRFGFCGIIAQDLPSWKDTTIIGWFTTVKRIKVHITPNSSTLRQ
jgi:hypothetical protein